MLEKNWFVLNYYKLDDLVSQTIEKENFIGRLEYDMINNKMILAETLLWSIHVGKNQLYNYVKL